MKIDSSNPDRIIPSDSAFSGHFTHFRSNARIHPISTCSRSSDGPKQVREDTRSSWWASPTAIWRSNSEYPFPLEVLWPSKAPCRTGIQQVAHTTLQEEDHRECCSIEWSLPERMSSRRSLSFLFSISILQLWPLQIMGQHISLLLTESKPSFPRWMV